MEFKKLVISGLYGRTEDIEIDFKDNQVVIIGENGLGKTSILNILYTILENKSHFSSYITYSGASLVVEKDGAEKKLNIKGVSRFPTEDEYLNANILGRHEDYQHFNSSNSNFLKQIELISSNFQDGIINSELKKQFEENIGDIDFLNKFHTTIYESAIKGLEYNQLKAYYESTKIYINHIRKKYQQFLMTETENDRQFLRNSYNITYLSINRMRPEVKDEYQNTDIFAGGKAFIEVTPDIRSILNGTNQKILEANNLARSKLLNSKNLEINNFISNSQFENITIDDAVAGKLADILINTYNLSGSHKDKIKEIFTTDSNIPLKVSLYQSLIDSLNVMDSKLNNINEFCTKMNMIFTNKKIKFDDGRNLVFYDENTKETFSLQSGASKLSSGERQIITILFNVILNDKPSILLIDEPELSLSIIWQQDLFKYLLDSNKVHMLFAVTHSPFIIPENKYEILVDLKEVIYG